MDYENHIVEAGNKVLLAFPLSDATIEVSSRDRGSNIVGKLDNGIQFSINIRGIRSTDQTPYYSLRVLVNRKLYDIYSANSIYAIITKMQQFDWVPMQMEVIRDRITKLSDSLSNIKIAYRNGRPNIIVKFRRKFLFQIEYSVYKNAYRLYILRKHTCTSKYEDIDELIHQVSSLLIDMKELNLD